MVTFKKEIKQNLLKINLKFLLKKKNNLNFHRNYIPSKNKFKLREKRTN